MQYFQDYEQSFFSSNQYVIQGSQNISGSGISSQYENKGRQICLQPNESLFYNIADIPNPSATNILKEIQNIHYKGNYYMDLGQKNLISLNSFVDCPQINDSEIMEQKQNIKNDQFVKPHLFKLIENIKKIFMSPNNIQKSSSIIIQGISGSGKTKVFLDIMRYLEGEQRSSISLSDKIEQRIIQSNNILESFGNAKTSNNLNSSRFGKIVEIKFNNQGNIINGKIITTLFEKNRVIQQRKNERNFHIFYQLVIGYQRIQALKQFAQQQNNSNEIVTLVEEIGKLKLDSNFAILVNNLNDNNEKAENQNNQDFESFTQLLIAFGQLNFTFQEILSIIQCIAGLIHLYEQNFTVAQELLKIPNLQDIINSQINQKLIEIESIINWIIVNFYYKLFDWIINKINQNLSLQENTDQSFTLNIFDSFGLEIVEDLPQHQEDQLEQFISNFFYEKLLNSYYNKQIDLSSRLFISENLPPLKVNFPKNDFIIDFVEKVVFTSLKDYIKQSNDINSKPLIDLIIQQSQEKGYQNYLNVNLNKNTLCIQHTGRDVSYQINSFFKNIQYPVSKDIQNINQQSMNQIIKSFTMQSVDQTTTLVNTLQFIEQWMLTFQISDLYFIKCFQTNYEQQPKHFDHNAMQIQLKYSGIEQSAQFLYQSHFLTFPKQQYLIQLQKIYLKISNEQDMIELLSPYQNNEDIIHFGSKNILIKESFYRSLNQKHEEHLKNIPYNGDAQYAQIEVELVRNFNKTKMRLYSNILLVEQQIQNEINEQELLQKRINELIQKINLGRHVYDNLNIENIQ